MANARLNTDEQRGESFRSIIRRKRPSCVCEAYIVRYDTGDQAKVGEKDETGCTNWRSGTGC
jgi:hypothetical protein